MTESRLPGLGSAGHQVPPGDAATGHHYLERATPKRLMLFTGRAHPDLANDIAAALGIELGDATVKTFANGETYCRYEDSIRGADVFIVQPGNEPVDRNLMELLIMVNAAKLASARRITAVIPWYPYSRQDKKSAPREPITAKLVAELLQVAGADRVLTMDLHAGQIQGFFTVPVDHMTALPLFADYFRDLGFSGDGVVSVSPDPGRAKMATKFAQMLDCDVAIMHKVRPAHDIAAVSQVIGKVNGKICLMGDDMIVTGGTLLAGARALREAGATAVYVFATHAIFAGNALDMLGAQDDVEKIVVTDSVPIDRTKAAEKITILPVAPLLAQTIWNVFSDDSVSAIFAGENQLF